jgi:hypothetical protein
MSKTPARASYSNPYLIINAALLDSLVVPGLCPHPAFGEVWVTKITDKHISFEAFIKPRTIARFKRSRNEFLEHNESNGFKKGSSNDCED